MNKRKTSGYEHVDVIHDMFLEEHVICLHPSLSHLIIHGHHNLKILIDLLGRTHHIPQIPLHKPLSLVLQPECFVEMHE